MFLSNGSGFLKDSIKTSSDYIYARAPTQLPAVLGCVQGKSDPDYFVMIGYQLGKNQQEKIVNEILEAYKNEMKNGWQPMYVSH